MNENAQPREAVPSGIGFKAILVEGAMVAVMGLVFALLANQLSPWGLQLARNYFPGAARPIVPPTPGPNARTNATGTNPAARPVNAQLAGRIRAQGLHVIAGDEVRLLFRDARYASEQVIFVDARDDEHYQKGHIPGAYQLDHYRVENYLPQVLPACLNAEQVVVYCTGGDCEDSEFTAVLLRDAGIPADKIFVYAGGISEWTARGGAVEIGARRSGQLQTPKP